MSAIRDYFDLVAVQDAEDVASHLLMTSDIHTSGLDSIKPAKDTEIVVLAGDVMGAGMDSDEAGERWLRNVFFKWAENVGEKGIEVVLIPGNHDRYLFRRWKAGRSDDWPRNVHYLVCKSATVRGLKFYGMPWCCNDRKGRFECDQKEMSEHCKHIPKGLDVLVVHQPPIVVGEKIDVQGRDGPHEGSAEIANAIIRAQPKICVCGHVHMGSRKKVLIGNTVVMNVARVRDDRSKGEVVPRKITLN